MIIGGHRIAAGTIVIVAPWALHHDPRSWGPDAAAFGPHEALSLARALRAACVDPAISAGEMDRGRLTVGQRADVVVLPAAVLEEPVVPGGPLATARPDMVLVDGDVVFER